MTKAVHLVTWWDDDRDKIEIDIPELGEFVPLHKFNKDWALFFRHEIHELDTYLPTERKFREPVSLVPRRGRVFDTFLLLDEGVIYDYEPLRKKHGKNFRGTYQFEQVVMVEVYSDCGSDGHIDYVLRGYRFVGVKALEDRSAFYGTMSAMVE